MMSRRGLETIGRLAKRLVDLEDEQKRVRAEMYDCIVEQAAAGETYRDIGTHAQLSFQRVSQIVNERRRKNSE